MKPELKLVENTGSQLQAEVLAPEPPPQQGEMPFAVVEGEPMTELPRDLYIPPDALQVFLEAFEGPLDLLLYLIRRQNLDILDIPIAEITRQYMKYIEVMADLQLELAGEYLLMAAMLAEIKSRMLLPRPPSADGHEEEDPRAELVRRLQEYERFKKAAEDIDRLTRLERDTMPASAELMERKVVKILPQVTLQEMLHAFRDVLSRAEMFAHHHVARERLSVRQRMSDILSNLREVAFVEFTQLFRAEEGRMGVTVTFIAILELMKEGLLEIVQAAAYAPIHVRTASSARHLSVVQGGGGGEAHDADAEHEAALAQPAHPDENEIPDEDLETSPEVAPVELSATGDSVTEAAHEADTEVVREVDMRVADVIETHAAPEAHADAALEPGTVAAQEVDIILAAEVIETHATHEADADAAREAGTVAAQEVDILAAEVIETHAAHEADADAALEADTVAVQEVDIPATDVIETHAAPEADADAAREAGTVAAQEVDILAAEVIETHAAHEADADAAREAGTVAAQEVDIILAAEVIETHAAREADADAAHEADIEAAHEVETRAADETEAHAARDADTDAAGEVVTRAADEAGTVTADDVDTTDAEASK